MENNKIDEELIESIIGELCSTKERLGIDTEYELPNQIKSILDFSTGTGTGTEQM